MTPAAVMVYCEGFTAKSYCFDGFNRAVCTTSRKLFEMVLQLRGCADTGIAVIQVQRRHSRMVVVLLGPEQLAQLKSRGAALST